MHGFRIPTLLLLAGSLCAAQPHPAYTPAEAQALVRSSVARELEAANRPERPMRYLLRKSSPRLTTTKEIFESRDGAVARLLAVNDRPLSPEEEQQESARLEALLNNPDQQRRRKKGQDNNLGVILKILRLLPTAFLYEEAGSVPGPDGPLVKLLFRPNPNFRPPDMETQAMTTMSGQLWIDPTQERVARLEGELQQDTRYAWGVLGKLDKGGSLLLEQTDVGQHQWRIVRLKLRMNLRIVWKEKDLDTLEEMSRYTPVPPEADYQQAIRSLRSEPLKR